jgi:hypothetical protein
MRSGFLNVDLDVETGASLDLLVTEMAGRVVVLVEAEGRWPRGGESMGNSFAYTVYWRVSPLPRGEGEWLPASQQ